MCMCVYCVCVYVFVRVCVCVCVCLCVSKRLTSINPLSFDRSISIDSDQVVFAASFEVNFCLILKPNTPLQRSCN